MLGQDENVSVKPLSREQHIVNLVKTIQSAEAEIKMFREHISDTKKSYTEQGWLTKDEVKLALKAYKVLKSPDDLSDIAEFAEIIASIVVQ
jgi:hypothetical protein